MRMQFRKTIYGAVFMLLLSQAAAVRHLYEQDHFTHSHDCVQCIQVKQYQTTLAAAPLAVGCPLLADEPVQFAAQAAINPLFLLAEARGPPVLPS
jgi:hypothetical protein